MSSIDEIRIHRNRPDCSAKPMTARRFPPPWTAEVAPNCFIVCDANGQTLSYAYYESERSPLSGQVAQQG